jgi:GNAT superfamily N-acetyltransferase
LFTHQPTDSIQITMTNASIEYRNEFCPDVEKVLKLYRANDWSSAEKPDELMHHLRNSHAAVTAWDADRLIGSANTLSDGKLVAYYSHLLVHPDYQGQGIGTEIARRLMQNYVGFHQQVLLADGRAIEFYQRLGFVPANETRSMWIFKGDEH